MKHGAESSFRRHFDSPNFFEGEFAFVQLTIADASAKNLGDHIVDLFWGGLLQGTGGSFAGIHQADDGYFLAPWERAPG